jgi:ribosomal protein L40E
MVTCPACGKENEDSSYECKRCRAPLREEEQPIEFEVAPESLGEVCRRCEAYNVPGLRVCSNCGAALFDEPVADKTPAEAFTPPSQVPETLSEELRALAISDEEAAEAGLTMGRNSSPDRTPPDPFALPSIAPPPPSTGRTGVAPPAVAGAAPAGAAAPTRRPPPAPPPSSGRTRPAGAEFAPTLPAEKPCARCGALNPPAAKFCFDCGTPFAKKAAPASRPPPSIQVDAELAAETYEDATMESAPVAADEAIPAESIVEEVPEEQPPPFAAKLVLETGNGQGTEFALAHVENSIGGSAAHIGLGEDAFVAPHAATLAFVEDRLVLRDEGSANGVYVKVRESAALEPGDLFLAGERLLRYEGSVELPRAVEGDPPFLGAPRAQGTVVRVTEVLAGAKTGRTCYRVGTISVGRTGCDMNFGSDSLLGAKHLEVRIGEDGVATLVDLGQAPGGVFLRVRAQQPVELQAGDLMRVGEQQLRVELG